MVLLRKINDRLPFAEVVPPSPTYRPTSEPASNATTPPDTPSASSRFASMQQQQLDAMFSPPRAVKRALQETWHITSTPPPPAQCNSFALHTRTVSSWRPLGLLIYGTTTRASALVSSHFASQAAARLFGNSSKTSAASESSTGDAARADNATFFACALVAGAMYAGSVSSALLFAKDTRRIDPARGRVSLICNLLGESMLTLSVWLGAFYGEKKASKAIYAAAAPKFFGLYLLTLRQSHSFCCSELVHGDTPFNQRIHLATHLFPVALAVLSGALALTTEGQVSPWANEIIFALCISLLVFSSALAKTDQARLRAVMSL